MDKKFKKALLIFLLFTIAFINKKKAYSAETASSLLNTSNTVTGSSIFTSKEGIVYKTYAGTNGITECKVVSYTGNSGNVVIPDEYEGYAVTSVDSNAFYGNGIVKNVVVGSNIKSTGRGAFAYCSYLKSISFAGNKIKSIPANCFESCGALKNIRLPASVEKINNKAFAFCTSLYQIIIPAKVTKFGSDIFYNCNKNRLTIIAVKNSKAEKFADKNGILVTDTDKMQLSASNFTDIKGSINKLYIYSAPSKVKWKSLNPGIVKVNPYGKITALKTGKAAVTATVPGQTLKCNIKILKRNKENCLEVIYSKYIKKEMSDYEKIYAAHAWLVQNVKYDQTFYKKGWVPAISHTAEGAFNRGTAVCDGYSQAFITIIRHYGIKCKMVTGGGHAWNMVKIKNKWYHIDCTYDDPVVNGSFNNKIVFMDFFLKTDKEMYTTHIWDYSAFPKCNSKKIDKNYRTK